GLVGERPGIAPAVPLVECPRARVAGDDGEPGARVSVAADFVLATAEQLRGHAGAARGAVHVHLLELVALDDDEPHDLAACRCRDPRAADTIARARQVLGGILAVRNEPRRHVADVAVGPSDHPDAADSLGVPWRGPAD